MTQLTFPLISLIKLQVLHQLFPAFFHLHHPDHQSDHIQLQNIQRNQVNFKSAEVLP